MSILPASLSLIVGMLGQVAAPREDETRDKEKPEAKSDVHTDQLDLMKQSLAEYMLHPANEPKVVLRLQPDPVLRFNNPVTRIHDSGIFLWLDPNNRPAAAVQVHYMKDSVVNHAFSSLSTGALVSDRGWNPARAGVEFKPVPDAPRPADSPEQRLRQMRELAKGFTAEMNWDNKTWHNLRLLSKPLARYGKPGTEALDGALFAFVLGTDAEVYLLLEVRNDKSGPQWQYAFAPEANATLRCSCKRTQVWEFVFDLSTNNNRGPYFFTTFAH